MTTEENHNISMGISFSETNWDCIKVIKTFVKSYLSLNLFNNDIISRAIITTSEMVENAIKYSINNKISLRISGRPVVQELKIEVNNNCRKKHAKQIINIIKEMNLASNSLEYYIRVMKTRPKKRTLRGGGLGIARVNHEAQAQVSVDYDKNNSEITVMSALYNKTGVLIN